MSRFRQIASKARREDRRPFYTPSCCCSPTPPQAPIALKTAAERDAVQPESPQKRGERDSFPRPMHACMHASFSSSLFPSFPSSPAADFDEGLLCKGDSLFPSLPSPCAQSTVPNQRSSSSSPYFSPFPPESLICLFLHDFKLCMKKYRLFLKKEFESTAGSVDCDAKG